MATQTNSTPAGKASPSQKKSPSRLTLWGIKNPIIYAGTVLFLVVVIVAFVFFPTSAGVGGSGMISFGSYGGKQITYTQDSYMVQQVQALSEANPATDTSDMGNQLRNYQIYRNAFELAVVHEGILDEVARAKVTVPDEILDAEIAGLDRFKENGAFSARLWRQTSSSERLAIRRQLKDDALVQSYAQPVYNVRPSSKETAFIKAMAADTRTVEYAVLPLSAYPDSEVAAWAAAKADDFLRLKLSRITLPKEADAKRLHDELAKGGDFAETAKTRSTDSWASQGGDLGLRFRHAIAGELATAEDVTKLSGLAKGALSPVLKTSNGSFAVYRLEAEPVKADFADPTVLADARDYLMQSQRGTVEDWALAKGKELSALAAKDFAANAAKAGYSVKTTEPFSLDYGNLQMTVYGQPVPLFDEISTTDAPELAGASRNETFLGAAFGLAPGAVSEPFVLGENVLVLRVKEAGTKEDDGLLDFYYAYFVQQKIDEEVRAGFLESPKLKDSFMDVYLKYFSPQTGN